MTKKSTKISETDLVIAESMSRRELDRMLGKDLEDVTDELIDALLKSGKYAEEDLINFQKDDFRYDRSTDSFLAPPSGHFMGKEVNEWVYPAKRGRVYISKYAVTMGDEKTYIVSESTLRKWFSLCDQPFFDEDEIWDMQVSYCGSTVSYSPEVAGISDVCRANDDEEIDIEDIDIRWEDGNIEAGECERVPYARIVYSDSHIADHWSEE